jgi:hypothetical protein
MTLPERILERLACIDEDRAQAVVKVTEAVSGAGEKAFKPVELVEMAPGKSLIVVGSSKALWGIPWLKMIEIAPMRYLLTVPSGTAVEVLEVALRDQFNDPDFQKDDWEVSILRELLSLIGHQRRSRRLSKAEILIVSTD